MYYEEQMIEGWLWFRTTPHGSWQKCTPSRYEEYLFELSIKEEYERCEALANSKVGAGA